MRSESCRFLDIIGPRGRSEYLAHSYCQSNLKDTGSYRVQCSSRDWSNILENISLVYGKQSYNINSNCLLIFIFYNNIHFYNLDHSVLSQHN